MQQEIQHGHELAHAQRLRAKLASRVDLEPAKLKRPPAATFPG